MSEIVEELQGCDAAVCFAVDATQIAKSLKVSSLRISSDNIVVLL